MFARSCAKLLKFSRKQICPCRLETNSPRKLPAARPNSIGKYILLALPATCIGLAYWQRQRKHWKVALIDEIDERYKMEPIELPQDLAELKDLHFYPIKVRGHFDYTNEVYIGPKPDVLESEKKNPKYAGIESKTNGVHVITPFKLSDRDLTILVNRGWYEDAKFASSEARLKGQVHGEQEIVGVLRHDQEVQYVSLIISDLSKPDRRNGVDVYFVRKIEPLAKRCGTAPVFLDARMVKKSVHEPKPLQMKPEIRNKHDEYMITWLCLGIVTAIMWYRKYSGQVRTSGVNAYLSQQQSVRNFGKSKT